MHFTNKQALQPAQHTTGQRVPSWSAPGGLFKPSEDENLVIAPGDMYHRVPIWASFASDTEHCMQTPKNSA